MSKVLVSYFSAEGSTASVAGRLADAIGADIFEIRPEKLYTKADLKYLNPMARCNREKLGKKDVPIRGRVENMEDYDVLFVGFPIWYAGAPNVVQTFLRGYNLDGKKIVLFATSGGSGMGKTAEKLKPFVGSAEIVDGRLLSVSDPTEELKAWAESLRVL